MFDEETNNNPPVHTVGEDLATLSIEELEKRVLLLRQEIVRLEQAADEKRKTMASAENFFKK